MGTVAFRPLSTAEEIFKHVVWDPMIKAGEVWIEGAVPFFNLPVIHSLEEGAVEAITDAMFNQIVCFIDVTAIRMIDSQRQTAWDKASEKLTILAKEQGVDSDAYKQALTDEAAAFAKFVHTGPQ